MNMREIVVCVIKECNCHAINPGNCVKTIIPTHENSYIHDSYLQKASLDHDNTRQFIGLLHACNLTNCCFRPLYGLKQSKCNNMTKY